MKSSGGSWVRSFVRMVSVLVLLSAPTNVMAIAKEDQWNTHDTIRRIGQWKLWNSSDAIISAAPAAWGVHPPGARTIAATGGSSAPGLLPASGTAAGAMGPPYSEM
eukprot:7271609-Pyramimonas_sp.AAC.1